MLQILGYHSTEAEAKRLHHNVTILSTGNDAVQDFRKDLQMQNNASLGSKPLSEVLGGDGDLQRKVNDFNNNVPKMAGDLDKLKVELDYLVGSMRGMHGSKQSQNLKDQEYDRHVERVQNSLKQVRRDAGARQEQEFFGTNTRGDNHSPKPRTSITKVATQRLERRISLKDIKPGQLGMKTNEDMSYHASARGEDSDAPYISDAY
jgi:hypothetical protein